jgi:hypothetical protein
MATSKTIKASGGDYTSLAAWEDAMDGNLTGTGYSEAVCYALDDTDGFIITGWTTTAADYIWIHTDSTARHAGVWDGDKYNLLATNEDCFDVAEDFVRFDGLQFGTAAISGANQDCLVINGQAAGATIWISNCIIKGANDGTSAQRGIACEDTDNTLYIWNDIIYSFGAVSGSRGITLNCTANVYSCVSICAGARAIACIGGTVTAKNTYAGGSSVEDFYYGAGTFAKTNCASEDASADDAGGTETATNCVNSVAIGTDTFINVGAGTENFHLAADGLSPLQGAGVSTSGEGAPLNFTTDIDGEARDATWDIGADCWVVATPSGYVNDICVIFEC